MRTFRRTAIVALVFSSGSTTSAAAPLTCIGGWGGNMKERVIPDELINDNFCDCPFDGADEPNTNACAGSAIWPGINPKAADKDASRHLFQCPQQPTKQLSLSRINDGICDCCDGADEPKDACPDICNEVLAAERAARARAEKSYKVGSQQRLREMQRFGDLVQATMVEIQAKEEELHIVEKEKETMEQSMDAAKLEQAQERFKVAKEVHDSSMWVEYFQHLTTDELFSLIMFACQLAGEQEQANHVKTCVPLRLAGIDMGILWEKQEDAIQATLQPNEEGQKIIAELIDQNSHGNRAVWSLNSSKQHKSNDHDRRHRPHRPMDDDDFDHDDEYFPDDDYVYDEDVDDYHHEQDSDGDSEEGKEDETREMVRGLALSSLRLGFLEHSKMLVEKIDKLLADTGDDNEEGEQEEEEKDGGEKQEKDDSRAANVDPVALPVVRNKLKRLQDSIERGFDYGVSAAVLLRALNRACEETDKDQLQHLLMGLALGTFHHGKMRAQDVWQMSVMILPEFEFESCTNEDTCEADPTTFEGSLARMCPARTIERNATPFPPKPILSAGQALCEEWTENPPSRACPPESDIEIPMSIPEGYCGYFPSQPRDGEDILSKMFAPLDWSESTRSQIAILEEKRDEVEEKRKGLAEKVHELEEQIGGRTQTKFGTNGELYSFRDTCLSVEAGKYVYEVCIFGKATQRDRDDDHGSGTDLGKWSGITTDKQTGARTLKWEGGAKCWNGPQRSATAIVTCGAETKVHKAEEPDTCRYVLEMESHIACDEAYKRHAGL